MAPTEEGAVDMVLSSPPKESTLVLAPPRDPAKFPKTGPTAKIGALCTAENCSRLAVLRWPGEEKDSRCTHHGEKGMLSRTFLCARDDLQCFKHARYGWPGQSVTHCEVHKEEGMVANDRESKRFTKPSDQAAEVPPDEERCTFYSRDFGIGQQRRCKRPRKEGYKQCEHHVELRRKRAQKAKEGGVPVPVIEAPPVPEEQRCTYWAQHPLRGRVQCKRERMADNLLCEMHTKNADRRKMCWVEGCQRTGSSGIFGFSLRLACSWHTACGMISKKDTQDRCFKLGCPARASMGPKASAMPMLCKEHANSEMAVLQPEGINVAPPKILNQPKKEELEALKEWDLVEQWLEKYTASPITDADQYRQDAYHFITRQRAEKMETFVRVRKAASASKPRRTKEEIEAAAEEKKRLAAEKDGWKSELAEKRQQVQLAKEAREAEKKRLAAEKAAHKAAAAEEKAAAKRAEKELAAAERAANGGGAKRRRPEEGGLAPNKRPKQGVGFTGVAIASLGADQALPVARMLPENREGPSFSRGVGTESQEDGEPGPNRGNVLGGFVFGGPTLDPVAGPGILVRPLAAQQQPATNTVTQETPLPQASLEAEVTAANTAGTPVTAPAGSAPVADPQPAGVPGAAPTIQSPPHPLPPPLVLGKVYREPPPEDVYTWTMPIQKQQNGTNVLTYRCSFPGCIATKLRINSGEEVGHQWYEVLHCHAPGVTPPPVNGLNVPGGGVAAGGPPPQNQQPGPPVKRSHTGVPIQVAVPASVYLQQQSQGVPFRPAQRTMFRPILPKPAAKPRQPKKKSKPEMDVLFVEECKRVFKPAGERGLSREEVKSFLSQWSKFPLDTELGQVKLQQALECGLFQDVEGGRYKLRENDVPLPPPKKTAAPKKSEGVARGGSTHAATMLKCMSSSPEIAAVLPVPPLGYRAMLAGESPSVAPGPVPVSTEADVKVVPCVNMGTQAVGGRVDTTGATKSSQTNPPNLPPTLEQPTSAGGGTTSQTRPPAAPVTSEQQLQEEPAVLALGAPHSSYPPLSPPLSELFLGEEERTARDGLPLSEEEEAMLRKLTVRKLQGRRSMVPAWLRESVTAGAERLAWLQARKDRMQKIATESTAEESRQGLEEERLDLLETPPETGPEKPAGIVRAPGSNLEMGDIPFDFPAVEDLPADQNWLTSPTAGFLGFAPDFQEADRGQSQNQAQESTPQEQGSGRGGVGSLNGVRENGNDTQGDDLVAQEGVRARIPQRKVPAEGIVVQAPTFVSNRSASESGEAAPKPVKKRTGKEALMLHEENVKLEQKGLEGAPKKRKWGEVQEEELLITTPEEEAMHQLLECRESPAEPSTSTQDPPSAE